MAKLRHSGGIVLAVLVIGCAAVWFLGGAGPIASSPSSPPLVLERTISLGMVKGRIDHLAIDVVRKRLFVAELGNDVLAAVDLERGEVLNTVTGLREPQGVAYVPGPDLVYIASAGDGSLRWFRGDLAPLGRLELGGDADNIRLDGPDRIMVGYGSGGLATVDAASGRKVGDVALPAHPEGFQIDAKRNRVDVNLPDRLQAASVDRSSGRGIGRWGLTFAAGNFPMTLDARRLITSQKAGCGGRRLPPVPPRPRGVGAVIGDDTVGVAWRVHDRGDEQEGGPVLDPSPAKPWATETSRGSSEPGSVPNPAEKSTNRRHALPVVVSDMRHIIVDV